MSTKASVASSEWSERINSFFRNKEVLSVCKVPTECLKCYRSKLCQWNSNKGSHSCSRQNYPNAVFSLYLPWLLNAAWWGQSQDRSEKLTRVTYKRDTYQNQTPDLDLASATATDTDPAKSNLGQLQNAAWWGQSRDRSEKSIRVTYKRDTYRKQTPGLDLATAIAIDSDPEQPNLVQLPRQHSSPCKIERGIHLKPNRATDKRDTYFSSSTTWAGNPPTNLQLASNRDTYGGTKTTSINVTTNEAINCPSTIVTQVAYDTYIIYVT